MEYGFSQIQSHNYNIVCFHVPVPHVCYRLDLAEGLTDGITAADDVVVINQYVDSDSGCVMSALMVMGPDG